MVLRPEGTSHNKARGQRVGMPGSTSGKSISVHGSRKDRGLDRAKRPVKYHACTKHFFETQAPTHVSSFPIHHFDSQNKPQCNSQTSQNAKHLRLHSQTKVQHKSSQMFTHFKDINMICSPWTEKYKIQNVRETYCWSPSRLNIFGCQFGRTWRKA